MQSNVSFSWSFVVTTLLTFIALLFSFNAFSINWDNNNMSAQIN